MPPTTTENAGLWEARLLEFAVLPSTNSWALEHLEDLQHGDIIQAHHQSAGRGRFDRQWLSPPGTCLTLSAVLDSPSPEDPLTVSTTRRAACAVRLTLEANGISGRLKWPNDVLAHNRKIAGILAERDAEAGKLVLGIGLNVDLGAETFDNGNFRQPATSMATEVGRHVDPTPVREDLLRNLETCISMNLQELQQEWTSHDALAGTEVSVNTVTDTHRGKYAGMDANGRLLLETADAGLLSFDSGDVSVAMPRK